MNLDYIPMEKIRAFVAIELSEGVKKELAALQRELKAAGSDVKWVKTDNVHLTLKFLGNIDEDQLEEVKAALDKVGSNNKAFTINLFKVGCFPKLGFPRVVWLGIDKGCGETEAIADELEGELAKAGFEKEKRSFSAHLTLGRVRSPKGRNKLVEKIKALDFKPSAETEVTKLTLFKSTLTPQGSIYTPLHEAALGKY